MSAIPATVERIENRTGDVRILTLAPTTPVAWCAGQYMHISVEGFGARAYSIASPPSDTGHMTFHVRNMGSGLSEYLSKQIKLGDTISLKGPHGDMNPDVVDGRPVLMVAGGTGIAPMLALAHDIIARDLSEEHLTLVYGARAVAAELYCKPELDALLATGKVSLHIINNPDTPDLHVRKLGMNLSEYVVYVSGPDPMMLPVHKALHDLLAERANIFCDADMEMLQKTS